MDAPTNPATSRVLTLATLREKGACKEQVAIFRKMSGARVEITEAWCVEHAGVFSWKWAAEKLLSTPARKAYREAVALARKSYDEARALAWARAYITDREVA